MKIKKPGSGSSSSMGASKSSSGSKSVSMKSIEPGEGVIHTSFLDQLTNVQIDDIKKSLKELIEEIDDSYSPQKGPLLTEGGIKNRNG